MDILHLIDRLESLVSQGTRVPGFGRTMIDADQMLDLIDQMRITVPKEVHDARRIVEDRDGLLNQARNEAQGMLAAARQEIETKLQSNDIVRLAQERAADTAAEATRKGDQILADAQADAAAIRREAEDYSIQVIRRLIQQIGSVQSQLEQAIGPNMPGGR